LNPTTWLIPRKLKLAARDIIPGEDLGYLPVTEAGAEKIVVDKETEYQTVSMIERAKIILVSFRDFLFFVEQNSRFIYLG
jgi:hypothetical protein